MPSDQPNPRYFKDPNGLKPTWRLFFHSPKLYVWLKLPMWLVTLVCCYRDRRRGSGLGGMVRRG